MTDTPEPGRQLYDAVRDMGLLPSAWGPWDTLSCEMQGDLAREEYCLVREVGPPAAEEPTVPTCRHHWVLADYWRGANKMTLFCCHCREVRSEYVG